MQRLDFSGSNAFQVELRRRVNHYFASTRRPKRDGLQIYAKATAILLAFVCCYFGLVFGAETWWQAVPLAVALGLVTALIGFDIMHDGGHQSFSSNPLTNRFMAHSLDVIGGSSYLWHWKHGVMHHSHSNIAGHDTDIELGKLARFSPHQPLYAHQRWQHWYIWPLYAVMAIKWHFLDDFRTLIRGKIGRHRIPRPRNSELLALIVCKLIFFALAFGVPLLFHPLWVVAVFYGIFAAVLGLALRRPISRYRSTEQEPSPMPGPFIKCTRPWIFVVTTACLAGSLANSTFKSSIIYFRESATQTIPSSQTS
jgi:linoleoyl-CoA desaturase